MPSDRLVSRLYARNSWLVESHNPLRETILLQMGVNDEVRRSFRQQIARDTIIHRWEPEEKYDDRSF